MMHLVHRDIGGFLTCYNISHSKTLYEEIMLHCQKLYYIFLTFHQPGVVACTCNVATYRLNLRTA